jgi:hypothetical protein
VVGPNRSERAEILREIVVRPGSQPVCWGLLQRGGELFRTRNSMPLSYQFAISSEHEHGEIRCSFRLAKLRRYRSFKIGRNENIFPRITYDLFSVISSLKPFCFFANSVPDECVGNPSPNHSVFSRKTDNCDHPVIRITQAALRDTVTHSAGLFPIRGRSQHDYGHVSVSCRMFVSINIDETQQVSCSDGKGAV